MESIIAFEKGVSKKVLWNDRSKNNKCIMEQVFQNGHSGRKKKVPESLL